MLVASPGPPELLTNQLQITSFQKHLLRFSNILEWFTELRKIIHLHILPICYKGHSQMADIHWWLQLLIIYSWQWITWVWTAQAHLHKDFSRECKHLKKLIEPLHSLEISQNSLNVSLYHKCIKYVDPCFNYYCLQVISLFYHYYKAHTNLL